MTSDRLAAIVRDLMVEPHHRVLEIGCGHGVAATYICQQLQTGHLLAIDRSATMIEAARRRNAAFITAGLATFQVGDFETLELGEQRFDRILAVRVRLFHDWPGPARELAERWLAPGGRILAVYDEP